MEETDLLGEYILNETGTLYMGNPKTISSRPWKFGQVKFLLANVLDQRTLENALRLSSTDRRKSRLQDT